MPIRAPGQQPHHPGQVHLSVDPTRAGHLAIWLLLKQVWRLLRRFPVNQADLPHTSDWLQPGPPFCVQQPTVTGQQHRSGRLCSGSCSHHRFLLLCANHPLPGSGLPWLHQWYFGKRAQSVCFPDPFWHHRKRIGHLPGLIAPGLVLLKSSPASPGSF